MTFMRKVLDLAAPKGPAHTPVPDGFLDKVRDATADNIDVIRTDVKNTAFIRTPDKTDNLDDLEREYGIAKNTSLSIDERKLILKSRRYTKATTGNDDDLQILLDNSGFNLTVYQNSPDGPAIDPNIILTQNFKMQAGDQTNDFAGQDDAYAGKVGGELLVNGDVFEQFLAIFGAGDVFAGNDNAVAGYFEELRQTLITYTIPTDPTKWPLIFFVGGAATFAGDGSILTIAQGLVPSQQEKQLKDIILKFKGLYSWCGLVVTFT